MRADYFEAMYAANEDPWGFGSRWYEQRKYALTLAALPQRRYRHVFEPGCSIGVLSEQLAARTDRLLAVDLVPTAVEATRARLAGSPTPTADATVRPWDMHDPWPETTFDLVVVSEVLYYLDADEAAAFMAEAAAHLDADGQVVVVHWRHEVPEYPLTGDQAQEIALATPALELVAAYRDEDFALTVLAHAGSVSVATQEGLD